MRTHKLLSVALLATLVFALRSSHADIVVMNDGTETEGEVVHEDTQTITLRVHMGAMSGLIEIKRTDVKSIKVSDVHADPAIAIGKNLEKEASLIKDVSKAIEAWMKVGEFYDQHAGFSTSAHTAFERVILLDPDNAKAREKLGFVKTANGWTSKDEIRRAEQAKEREAAALKTAAIVAARNGQATAPEDITIELRRDNDLVKQMKEQHNELVQGIAELDQRGPAPVQPIGCEDFVPPYNSVLWNNGFGFGGLGGFGGFGGFGGGYGGFGNYGCSNYSSYNNCYSGFSFGFRGRIGSGRFSGRIGF